MLKVAKTYEAVLQLELQETILKDKYKWYHRDYAEYSIHLDENNWNKAQLVSVNKDNRVIGYLCANISRQIHTVDNISCINFEEKPSATYSNDIKRFLNYLVKELRVKQINWGVVVGNPIEKAYDKLCTTHGGRIVGVKKNNAFVNGKLYDLKMYEWINPNEDLWEGGVNV